MTSLTPHSDACEATIAIAKAASEGYFGRKDKTGIAARVSFATNAAFNRAMAAEQDGGAGYAELQTAIVVTLSNLIGAICTGHPDPVAEFNRLMLSVSVNASHRLKLKDGVFFVEPKKGQEPGRA